mmetsp:Transcript_41808/g.163983  ORF Transcript_41808/g.163983 Transcript_41808/m.163983 type:complete len:81 (+) Transcript_41808:431-673(+)
MDLVASRSSLSNWSIRPPEREKISHVLSHSPQYGNTNEYANRDENVEKAPAGAEEAALDYCYTRFACLYESKLNRSMLRC